MTQPTHFLLVIFLSPAEASSTQKRAVPSSATAMFHPHMAGPLAGLGI